MIHTVQNEKKRIGLQEQHAEVNDGRVLREQPDEPLRKNTEDNCDHRGHGDGHEQRRQRSFVRTVFLPCTDILTDKGGCSHRHAAHGQHDELIQLIVTSPPRHTGGSEIIDIRLNKHIGKRSDHGLDSRRQPDLENFPDNPGIDVQLLPGEPIYFPRKGQQPQRQRSRNSLRNNRRPGYSGNAQTEDKHKEQIQGDVQQTSKDQEHQGTGCISHSAEDSAADVINQKAGDSAEIDGQINAGISDDVFRRRHHAQHRPDAQDSDGCKEKTEEEGHGDRGFNGAVETFRIPGSEMTGNHHAGSDGKAVKEEDQHIDNHGG